MPQHAGRFRLGQRVRVTHQAPEKAKLAVCGYGLHEHFGEEGVVTSIVEHDERVRYVVRFDDYGRDAVPYRREELAVV